MGKPVARVAHAGSCVARCLLTRTCLVNSLASTYTTAAAVSTIHAVRSGIQSTVSTTYSIRYDLLAECLRSTCGVLAESVYVTLSGSHRSPGQDHMARPEPGATPGASQTDGPVWGHWASSDLVRFAQLDVALWNGAADGADTFDDVGVYTGSSTVVDGKIRIMYPGLCNHGKGDCPDPKCAGGHTTSWAGGDPHDCPSKNIVIATPANYSDPLLRNWTKASGPVRHSRFYRF